MDLATRFKIECQVSVPSKIVRPTWEGLERHRLVERGVLKCSTRVLKEEVDRKKWFLAILAILATSFWGRVGATKHRLPFTTLPLNTHASLDASRLSTWLRVRTCYICVHTSSPRYDDRITLSARVPTSTRDRKTDASLLSPSYHRGCKGQGHEGCQGS